MKPKKPENTLPQYQLFKTRLEDFLNKSHPLFVLSGQMDWEYFDLEFGSSFSDQGRPGLPTRLMVGLTYLKHTFDCSDEALIEMFVENGYWQYFCGFEYFQHSFPCDPTSLVRWRKRLGEEGCKKLLEETLRIAHKKKLLKSSHLKEVIVDTTVQEKNITPPTDAKLYYKMRELLVKAAKERGIDLRQSYVRVAKELKLKQAGYAHAKQYNRSKKATNKLKTFMGRVMRDIRNKALKTDPKLEKLLGLAHRLFWQAHKDKNKLYSLHEPQVDCIGKGKAHKPYEFGCKTSLVATAQGNWVLNVSSFHRNPYDGHTLKEVIQSTEESTGVSIKNIFVDKGYRGSKHWPQGKKVFLSGRRNLKGRFKKLLKRRSAIEPIFGHMKQSYRLKRNFLKGGIGDHVNGILSGTAYNFKKLLNYFRILFIQIWIQFKIQNIKLNLRNYQSALDALQ